MSIQTTQDTPIRKYPTPSMDNLTNKEWDIWHDIVKKHGKINGIDFMNEARQKLPNITTKDYCNYYFNNMLNEINETKDPIKKLQLIEEMNSLDMKDLENILKEPSKKNIDAGIIENFTFQGVLRGIKSFDSSQNATSEEIDSYIDKNKRNRLDKLSKQVGHFQQDSIDKHLAETKNLPPDTEIFGFKIPSKEKIEHGKISQQILEQEMPFIRDIPTYSEQENTNKKISENLSLLIPGSNSKEFVPVLEEMQNLNTYSEKKQAMLDFSNDFKDKLPNDEAKDRWLKFVNDVDLTALTNLNSKKSLKEIDKILSENYTQLSLLESVKSRQRSLRKGVSKYSLRDTDPIQHQQDTEDLFD